MPVRGSSASGAAGLLISLLTLAGCSASQTRPHAASGRSQTAQAPTEQFRSGLAAPSEGGGSELLAALDGLTFDSGYVEIDAVRAAIVLRGIGPTSAEHEEELARSAEEAGNFLEAVRHRAHVVLLAPDSARGCESLARNLFDTSALPQAAAGFRSAIQRDPSSDGARFKLGMCAQMLGNLDDAARSWRQLVERNPAHATGRRDWRSSSTISKTTPRRGCMFTRLRRWTVQSRLSCASCWPG